MQQTITNFLTKASALFTYKNLFIATITGLFITTLRKKFLKHYKKWLDDFSEAIMFVISKYVKKSLAATFCLKSYCKNQLNDERYKNLYIPSRDNIALGIEQLFVSLSIALPVQKEENYTHKNILDIGNRIIIMGDPGAGKSSLIKKIFRDCCAKGKKNPYKSKLPILIELKGIIPPKKQISKKGEWLLELIKRDIQKQRSYQIGDCFDSYSQTNGILFLLDGMDEVSSTNYKFVKDCINSLSVILNGLASNNSIVLTMRSQYYRQVKNDFSENFPLATSLKPFSPSEIYEFLTRWPFQQYPEKNIARIYSDLTDRPTLREMCSNPLVLSMYVAEDKYNEGQVSPESRTLFYGKIMDELIIKRRQRQTGYDNLSIFKMKEQREKILGEIAFRHLAEINESRNRLNYFHALSIIKKVVDCNENEAEQIFNEILKETGLISIEQQSETFRFIHLSFCEFLAAGYVAKYYINGWSELTNVHKKLTSHSKEGKSRLIDVISFSIALLKPSEINKAIADVANLKDDNLLAKCFLETKNYEHVLWMPLIQRMKNNILISNASNIDDKWLADLHIFNVVVKDADIISKSVNIQYNFNLTDYYRDLVVNNRSIINQILGAYAKQDAVAVFRICEFTQLSLLNDFPQIIVNNCDQQPFLGLIKDKILNEEKQSLDWIKVLTDSALQKQLVARRLYDTPAIPQLTAKIHLLKSPDLSFGKASSNSFLFQCYSLSAHVDKKHIILGGKSFKPLRMLRKYYIRQMLSNVPRPLDSYYMFKKLISTMFSFNFLIYMVICSIAIYCTDHIRLFLKYKDSWEYHFLRVLGSVIIAISMQYVYSRWSKHQRKEAALYLQELNLK